MNCDEFLSLIDSMLDGEISIESTALANTHADTCNSCGLQRDRLTMLHERMAVLSDNIEVPDSLENRVKNVLSDEVKRNRKTNVFNFSDYFKAPKLALAAGILSLILVGLYVYLLNQSQVRVAQGPAQKIQTGNFSPSSVSAADLVEHTHDHLIAQFHYAPSELPALVKQSGFNIRPPQITGWRLGDVCVCSIGKNGQPVVHMTYISTKLSATTAKRKRNQLKPPTLTCYQVLNGHFDSIGMKGYETSEDSHNPVWFSEVNNLTVAFVKKQESEYIFVGAMPLREIANIANNS
ncbi:MAG: hypothetical protein P4L53_15925 [Candidatus Obscuribacterales bacterium]|nr:hypothetical protein [Candidatus Obscuribacterales bacterium]